MSTPLTPTDWPKDGQHLGAVHILAMDLFIAQRCAFYHDDHQQATTQWIGLVRAVKDRWIENARLILETYRPYPLRPENAPSRTVASTGGAPRMWAHLYREDNVVGLITPAEPRAHTGAVPPKGEAS